MVGLTPIPLGVSAPIALLLLGAMISTFQHTQIDYRIVGYLNSFAGRSQLLDQTMHGGVHEDASDAQ